MLSYQRELVQAGLFSISDPALNKRGFDSNIVIKAIMETELALCSKFTDPKRIFVNNYEQVQSIDKRVGGDQHDED